MYTPSPAGVSVTVTDEVPPAGTVTDAGVTVTMSAGAGWPSWDVSSSVNDTVSGAVPSLVSRTGMSCGERVSP